MSRMTSIYNNKLNLLKTPALLLSNSIAMMKFANRGDSQFVLVGTVKDLTLNPRSSAGGFVHVYLLTENNEKLEFLHKTPEETLELVFSETPVELYKEIPKEKRRLHGDLEGISIMFIPQWMFSSARNDVVRKLSEPNFQVRYMEKYGLENLKLALYNLGKFKVADIPLMIRHIPD